MAFRLTNDEQKDKTKHESALREGWAKVEDAKAEAEGAIQQAMSALKEAINEFQTAVENAEGFRDEVSSRLREEFDDKSETWQEGDRGQEASSVVESWENTSFQADDLEVPEIDLDLADGNDIISELEGLPVE